MALSQSRGHAPATGLGLPPADWAEAIRQAAKQPKVAEDAAADVAPEFWHHVHRRLARWGPALAQGGVPITRDEEADEIEVMDTMHGISCMRAAARAAASTDVDRSMYTPAALLDQLMLGALLRNRGQARFMVQLAMKVGVPKPWREAIAEQRLMSKASMSRAQRIVDTAYMLWWRHDWQQRGPRYYIGMAGSSTQGSKGVDWLNSQMHYVLRADAIHVHCAWRSLVRLVGLQGAAWAAGI